MPTDQLRAGQRLVADIRNRYPGIRALRHSDMAATGCPGEYFPFDALAGAIVPAPAKKLYRVQVGAFSVRENAEALQEEIKAKGYDAFIQTYEV